MQMQFDLELEEIRLDDFNKVCENGTKARYYFFIQKLISESKKNDELKIKNKNIKEAVCHQY